MTLFTHLDKARVDSIVDLMQSSNSRYKPSFSSSTEIALKSDDLILKIVACVDSLIQWQNELKDCQNDPDCKVLFNHDQYEQYAASQGTLNKLKRKLSRAFFEGLDPQQKEIFINKIAAKYKFQAASLRIEHMFRYQGDDDFCLEMMGQCMNSHLNSPIITLTENPVSIILHPDSNHSRPNLHHILAVASAAEHYPLASNTFGYRGQPKNAWSNNYSVDKANAILARRDQFKGDNKGLQKTTYWDKAVNMSQFKQNIQTAKKFDGNPIANCWERSLHVFHRITKRRQFDSLSRVKLAPGDHWFAICDGNVLDAWNGARIYPEALKEKLLYDYRGFNINDGRPVVTLYEPTQKISVNAYNLYPLEAFKKDSTTKHLPLIELLNQFHQIPNQQQQDKMIKALEIIQFIEQKLPLYPYIDPAVNELYDQMFYLTKKVRKNGLKLPSLPDKDRCLINEALQNLDLSALYQHLKNKEKPDALTIFHAMKACLRSNNTDFLRAIASAGIQIPVEATPFTQFFDSDPAKAIITLAKNLYIASGQDFMIYCEQILQNR
jgi:hypothetical protein